MVRMILIIGCFVLAGLSFLSVYACCVAAGRADREADNFLANYKVEQEKKLCEK